MGPARRSIGIGLALASLVVLWSSDFHAQTSTAPVAGQTTSESQVWDAGARHADWQASSTLQITNECKKAHSFAVTVESASFLRLLFSSPIKVGGHQSVTKPVRFHTDGLSLGDHTTQVGVKCLDCTEVPPCTQDRQTLVAHVKIVPGPGSAPVPDPSRASSTPPAGASSRGRSDTPTTATPPASGRSQPPATARPAPARGTASRVADTSRKDPARTDGPRTDPPAGSDAPASGPPAAAVVKSAPAPTVVEHLYRETPPSPEQHGGWMGWLVGILALAATAVTLMRGSGGPVPGAVVPPTPAQFSPQWWEGELKKAATRRDEAARKLKGAIDKYNQQNDEYYKAQQDYLQKKQAYDDWRDLVEHWDPKQAPLSEKHTISQREIEREKDEHGGLTPPTKGNVVIRPRATRRMTLGESEEELIRLKKAMDLSFVHLQDEGKKWTAARAELDKISQDIKQAGQAMDDARWALTHIPPKPFDPLEGVERIGGLPVMVSHTPKWEREHMPSWADQQKLVDEWRQRYPGALPDPPPKFDPMEGVETVGGVPVMVSHTPEWEREHLPTPEQMKKMIDEWREKFPPVIYDPPQPDPGTLSFDDAGRVVGWWLPGEENVDEEIRYYRQFYPNPSAPKPAAQKPDAPVAGKPTREEVPATQEDEDDDEDWLGLDDEVPDPLGDEVRRWAKDVLHIDDEHHPLIEFLLQHGERIGTPALLALLKDFRPADPIEALISIMERTGDPNVTTAEWFDRRHSILEILEAINLRSELRQAWLGSLDPDVLRNHYVQQAIKMGEAALKTGDINRLMEALVVLGRPADAGGAPDHSVTKQVVDALKRAASEQEGVRNAQDLERIHRGGLTIKELHDLAMQALKDGRIEIMTEALLKALETGTDPLEKRVADALGLVQLLQQLAGLPAPQPPAGTNPEIAKQGLEMHQHFVQTATLLLADVRERLRVTLGAKLDEEIQNAQSQATHAGGLLAKAQETQAKDPIKRLEDESQRALGRVKTLTTLKLMLQTVGLPKAERDRALNAARQEAEAELRKYEAGVSTYDDDTTRAGNALGRLNALRAGRDAVEDLIFGFDDRGVMPRLDIIFDRLNGTWHPLLEGSGPGQPDRQSDGTGTPSTAAKLNHRENGVRQQLDAGGGTPAQTRRLQDELQYLERRRIDLLFSHPSWNGADKYIAIKQAEVGYWNSQRPWRELAWMGETPADRIGQQVAQYRGSDLGVLLAQLATTLNDPQGFLRLVSRLRSEDLKNGADAWERYYATSFHERGLIVQTYRFMKVLSIQDAMLEEHALNELFRAAGELTPEALKRDLPQGYATLERLGFIRDGVYVIPDEFKYTPETTGSQMSQRHWLDDLVNLKSVGEAVLTVVVPAAGAGLVVGGIRAAEGAGLLTRAGYALLRGGVEAGVFTLFGKGANLIVHPFSVKPSDYTAGALAKDYANNLVVMLGLGAFGTLSKSVEAALIGEGRLAGVLTKDIGQVSRADLVVLLKGAGLDVAKTGIEGALLTGAGALPYIGHDGEISWKAWAYNVIFAKELAFAHELAPNKSAQREHEAKIGERRRIAEAVREADKRAGESRMKDEEEPVISTERPGFAPADPVELSRRLLRELGIDPDLPDHELQVEIGQYLKRAFKRIARDPNESPARRELARLMRSFIKPIDTPPLQAGQPRGADGPRSPLGWLNRIIPVRFVFDPASHDRGGYDPITRTVTLNLASIARSLDHYWQGEVTPEQFLRSLMGTAVHETVAHGLQRTDTVPIHAGGTPRLYTGLHEIEAYLAQRLFDPTLGEKYDAGGYGDDHDALEWIVQRVYRGYLGERPGPQPGTTQPSLIEAVRRRVQGWLGRDYSWEIYPGIEGQPGPALVYVKRPTRGQRTTLDAINRLRRRLGLEPLPASEAGRRRTATLPEPPEFTLDDDEDDPPRMSEIEGTPSIKPADQSSKMAPKMAPLVERLAQIAAAGRTPTREEILELQRNTPAMRSLKKADPKLRLLFNTELRKLTDAHDAALLQYIRDHHPQYAGRNLRVHDFRTPGTKDDGTAINTDRDYRVLCLDGEREREVPRRLWDHESHRLFASLTGYSPAKARALMTPEMQARWDRIPSRYPEPGKADARQVEMWAELHQWLATDVWHPEASLEFTDQPTYAYLPPLLRTPGADGRLIVEALKQIIAVTQHRTSVLLQPQRFGMMYNEKVDVYLRMGNKVEALAQLAKGIKMWRSVRRAYRLQGYGLPPLRLNFDLACESVSQLDPFDHTVTPDVLREFERRLQELGFSGIRALKDRLDFEFHSFIFLEEKGAQPRKPMPLADTGEGTSLAAPEAPNARAGEGGAWSVTPGVIPPDAAGPAQPASPVVDLSPLLERGAARRTLAHDIAPIAVAFDLRRWREHVRGDERGEGVLLELLRSSGIGGDVDEAAMAEELDRRLSGLPAPPTGMNVAALRDDLDASAGRWRANPGDIALAGRVLRLRTVLGGILGVPASPLSDVPLAALPLWAESPTADERAQMAVVSAARIARHPLVERDLRIHLDVLAASGTGAGDVPLAEARAALEHRDWSAFWPALIRAHDAVTSPLLREVCQ